MVQLDHQHQELGHHCLKGLSPLGTDELRQAAWTQHVGGQALQRDLVGLRSYAESGAGAPVNDCALLRTVAALQQQQSTINIREALCNLHAHMIQGPCWRQSMPKDQRVRASSSRCHASSALTDSR